MENISFIKKQGYDRIRPPHQGRPPTTTTTAPKKIKEKKRFCSGNGCTKNNASFLCPKCSEKGISTYFCSQECFKLNYNSHKAIHQTLALTKIINQPQQLKEIHESSQIN